MQIEMPITYEVSGILPRGRKPTTVKVLEKIAIDIPELSGEDAPVALRWLDPDESRHGRDVVISLRWLDGRLFDLSRDRDGDRASITPDTLERTLANGTSRLNLNANLEHHFRSSINHPYEAPENLPFREITQNGREEAIEALNAKLSKVIFIDGILWEVAGEPVLIYNHPRSGEESAVKVVRPGTHEWDSLLKGNASYRMDQFDRIVETFDEVYAAAPDLFEEGARELLERHRIEVLIPQAVNQSLEGPWLLKVLDRALTRWDWPSLRNIGYDEAVALALLRKMKGELGEDPTTEQMDDLAMALDAYGQTLDSNELLKGRIANAVERWGERPIDIDLAAPAP